MPVTLSHMTKMLGTSLRDASNKLADDPAALARYVKAAALDLSRVRPRVRAGSITLAADVSGYELPADARRFHTATWVDKWRQCQPWDVPSGLRPPVASVRVSAGGGRELQLSPAPTWQFIQVVGAAHTVHYYSEHVITDSEAECTIDEADEHLLLARAQAEAMKELALRGVGKPVTFRNGSLGVTPSNTTPSALHKMLMDWFEKAAADAV